MKVKLVDGLRQGLSMKKPLVPPDFFALMKEGLSEDTNKTLQIIEIGPLHNGRYYHWDTMMHMTPPEGLSVGNWWLGTKMARKYLYRKTPLLDKDLSPFVYAIPDPVLRMLQMTDRDASGEIQLDEEVTNPQTKSRYIVSSLIQEAVTSSQLEGATTTVAAAKDMIRTGRKPIDTSEQMVWNNYQAMQYVSEHKNDPLSLDMITSLHRIVTEKTLRNPADAGRLRRNEDEIQIEDLNGRLLHLPPDANYLKDRIKVMCDFANDTSQDAYIHPVIRAIILHFWIGYDHPFIDGNGRTARALFYWSMLSQGYWLSEYVSISRILKKAPAKYAMSYLHTETDDNDLTYFIIYQLEVLRRAIDELHNYLARKIGEVRRVESLLRKYKGLNHRQLALLSYTLKHPGMTYTFESHKNSHNVAYQTARTDLLDLASKGLLVQSKMGKTLVFRATGKLEALLQKLNK